MATTERNIKFYGPAWYESKKSAKRSAANLTSRGVRLFVLKGDWKSMVFWSSYINGDLCPVEQIVSKDKAYRAVSQQITEAMGVWRKRLTEEEYKQLEDLLNLRVQTGEMDLIESFVHGFKQWER